MQASSPRRSSSPQPNYRRAFRCDVGEGTASSDAHVRDSATPACHVPDNRVPVRCTKEKGCDAMNGSASKKLSRVGLALGAALASTMLSTTVSTAAPGGVGGVAGVDSVARTVGRQDCPVVYFDLGETLVHTADDGSITYQSGAASYLRALRERHIRIGLITNVPPSWGATDAERAARLKKEVDATWKGPEPFAWKDFGGRILTPAPRRNANRLPLSGSARGPSQGPAGSSSRRRRPKRSRSPPRWAMCRTRSDSPTDPRSSRSPWSDSSDNRQRARRPR